MQKDHLKRDLDVDIVDKVNEALQLLDHDDLTGRLK